MQNQLIKRWKEDTLLAVWRYSLVECYCNIRVFRTWPKTESTANKDPNQPAVLICAHGGIGTHNLKLKWVHNEVQSVAPQLTSACGKTKPGVSASLFGLVSPSSSLLQYSFSPLWASWERWAQTAGLVKDPSWDADNVLYQAPLLSAGFCFTDYSSELHQKWLFVFELLFFPFYFCSNCFCQLSPPPNSIR